LKREDIIVFIIKDKKERIERKEEELEKIKEQMLQTSGFKSTDPENEKGMMWRRAKELETAISRHREAVSFLENLTIEHEHTTIGVGALVKIRGLKGVSLIVPKAEIFPACLEIEGQEIRFISAKSPVGQKLLGLRRGEKTIFNQELEIMSID